MIYEKQKTKELHSLNAQRLRLGGFREAVEALGKSYRIVTELDGLSNFGGIVCSTDHYAIDAIRRLGHRKDLIISGFDNVSFLENLDLKILTVDYSTDRIAEECINYLLGRQYRSNIEYKLRYNTDKNKDEEL